MNLPLQLPASLQATLADASKSPSDKSWEVFVHAARVVFAQWTTLHLAIANQWGGVQSSEKADSMLKCLLEEFNDVRLGKGRFHTNYHQRWLELELKLSDSGFPLFFSQGSGRVRN